MRRTLSILIVALSLGGPVSPHGRRGAIRLDTPGARGESSRDRRAGRLGRGGQGRRARLVRRGWSRRRRTQRPRASGHDLPDWVHYQNHHRGGSPPARRKGTHRLGRSARQVHSEVPEGAQQHPEGQISVSVVSNVEGAENIAGFACSIAVGLVEGKVLSSDRAAGACR